MTEVSFTISADHPALPGHFPGRPVVPGAVLLDHAMALTEQQIGHAINRVVTAKFPRPLAPDVPCVLELDASERGQVRVRCTTGDGPVLIATFGHGKRADTK